MSCLNLIMTFSAFCVNIQEIAGVSLFYSKVLASYVKLYINRQLTMLVNVDLSQLQGTLNVNHARNTAN